MFVTETFFLQGNRSIKGFVQNNSRIRRIEAQTAFLPTVYSLLTACKCACKYLSEDADDDDEDESSAMEMCFYCSEAGGQAQFLSCKNKVIILTVLRPWLCLCLNSHHHWF